MIYLYLLKLLCVKYIITYELKLLAEVLSQKGYHVILNNLPGHGTNVDDCNKYQYTDWLDYSKIEFAKLCSSCDNVFIIGWYRNGIFSSKTPY